MGDRLSQPAMEGGGAYNKNSALQAAGGALALPLLEQAARDVPIDTSEAPVVLADFGASQGKNSLLPLSGAIHVLRRRIGQVRPISVVHTDLPTNDFSTLFQLLDSSPDSYLQSDQHVYSYAAGRSFYEPLFPTNTITLGWSSYALMWPSKLAASIPGHIYSTRSTREVLEAFNRRADEDWRRFLSLRASEFRKGGRLVVVIAARDDEGLHGLEPLMDHANAVLLEMLDEGALSRSEHERIVLPAHPKSRKDLLAPFGEGRFCGLRVAHCDVFPGPDPAWVQFGRDRDAQRLAHHRAGFFRAAFAPTFAEALQDGQSAARQVAFSDRLEQGLQKRVASHPAEMRLVIGVMMVVKD